MRSTLIVDLFLGFARAFFTERNNSTAVDFVDRVADAKKSGENVDDHMRSIADFLAGDAELDFSGLKDRINEEVDELLERGGEPDPLLERGGEPDPLLESGG